MGLETYLGWRFSRWLSAQLDLGMGTFYINSNSEDQRTAFSTLHATLLMRLTLPPFHVPFDAFVELGGGVLTWLAGDASDEVLPADADLPSGFQVIAGAGLEMPIAIPQLTFTVRLRYHRLLLSGPQDFVRGAARQRFDGGTFSVAAGLALHWVGWSGAPRGR